MLMSVIQPMVETIKNVLRFLIECQQSDFKDLTPVAVLLKVSCFLCGAGRHDTHCNDIRNNDSKLDDAQHNNTQQKDIDQHNYTKHA
jgi:hypothetical protein